MPTAIEWCDETTNPIRARNRLTGALGWYCEKVSEGCRPCYAENLNLNFRKLKYGGTGLTYNVTKRDAVEIFLDKRVLEQPLHWRKPKRIFICDMTDLFGEFVPEEMIFRIFDMMNRADWHHYQLLTKRHERLLELSPRLPWAPHIWAGVSVESERWLKRVDYLRRTGAHVKFVSLEPLLGPLPNLNLSGIDWAIAGGTSGSKKTAHVCETDWIRDIIQICRRDGAAVFVKQLGSNPHDNGLITIRHKKGGDPAEWPGDLRIRKWPRKHPADVAEGRKASE